MTYKNHILFIYFYSNSWCIEYNSFSEMFAGFCSSFPISVSVSANTEGLDNVGDEFCPSLIPIGKDIIRCCHASAVQRFPNDFLLNRNSATAVLLGLSGMFDIRFISSFLDVPGKGFLYLVSY